MTRPDSRLRMLREGYGLRTATKAEALAQFDGPQDYEPVSWSPGLDRYMSKPANFQFFQISDEDPPRVIAYVNDPRGPKGGQRNPFVEYEPARSARTESLVQEHDWKWNVRAGDGSVEFVAYDSSSGNVAIWTMRKGSTFVRTSGDSDSPTPPVEIIKKGKQILGEDMTPQAFADMLLEHEVSVDDPVWKAAGMMNGLANGNWSAEEFEQRYGFRPQRYPQYFEVMPRTGLVVYKPAFRRDYEAVSSQARRNWGALGVGA